MESELGLSGREILPVSGEFLFGRRDKVGDVRIQNHLDRVWWVQVLWKICVLMKYEGMVVVKWVVEREPFGPTGRAGAFKPCPKTSSNTLCRGFAKL